MLQVVDAAHIHALFELQTGRVAQNLRHLEQALGGDLVGQLAGVIRDRTATPAGSAPTTASPNTSKRVGVATAAGIAGSALIG